MGTVNVDAVIAIGRTGRAILIHWINGFDFIFDHEDKTDSLGGLIFTEAPGVYRATRHGSSTWVLGDPLVVSDGNLELPLYEDWVLKEIHELKKRA